MGFRSLRVGDFVTHLRLRYQLTLLSGAYLLGGLYTAQLPGWMFWLQFFNVAVLLNGGVTAYNSFWDDDDGPIGGIEHPPKMLPWMKQAALLLQLVGFVLVFPLGITAWLCWITTMALSVLYSHRRYRWKSHAWLSLIAVGVGTGVSNFVLGQISAESSLRAFSRPETWLQVGLPESTVWIGAIGVAGLLLAMYPVSQVFQIADDREAGDKTFAVTYGLSGVRRFYVLATGVGLPIAAFSLQMLRPMFGLAFFAGGLLGGIFTYMNIRGLKGIRAEYKKVMQLKLLASASFVLILLAAHAWLQLASSNL